MLEWMRRGGPEIVSIHIPKTGGTSFWRVLEHIYGPKAVQRVFPREYEAEAPISVKRGIRALHGHFRYADLGQRVQVASPVKLVTWLRNPVDRVISNYHYRIEKQEMTEVGLRSYAARSTARNRMARHLEGDGSGRSVFRRDPGRVLGRLQSTRAHDGLARVSSFLGKCVGLHA